eukprot:1668058-Pyramimonas_sp.AAC.1
MPGEGHPVLWHGARALLAEARRVYRPRARRGCGGEVPAAYLRRSSGGLAIETSGLAPACRPGARG